MKDLSKEKLEDLLYNGDLELDELIELKKNMNNFDFNESEKEYINEQILDKIDIIDDVNEIIKLKEKYKSNSDLFDKIINQRNLINIKEIEDMNKEELEILLYDGDLNAVELLRLYSCMKKYEFDNFDYGTIIDYLREAIEGKDINELAKIKKEAKKYKCDTSIIDKYAKYILSKKYDKRGKIKVGKVLFWSLIAGMISEGKQIDNTLMPWEKEAMNDGYEPFNFEEELLEEDDYYFEDNV